MRMRYGLFVLLFLQASYAQQYGWVKQAQLSIRALRAVDFVDSLHGWVLSDLEGIYRTSDGGKTWIPVLVEMTGRSISMIDSLRGWCVGDRGGYQGKIYHTSNGGRSWDLQFQMDKRNYTGVAAQTIQEGITVGRTITSFPDTGKIVRTTNGGSSWKEGSFSDSVNYFPGKVVFVDSLHGWVTGASVEGPRVARTVDGGVSWSLYSLPSYFGAISFIDTSRGWAAAEGIYQTRDGGLTWQRIYTGTLGPSAGISFVDSLNGWIFSTEFYQGIDTESIYRTTDGGRNWYRESISLTGDFGGLNDGVMLDRFHGWAVSGDGAVLSYQLLTSVVEKVPVVPKGFWLKQNYPNPFNPTTTIEYSTLKRGLITLKVYDILGKEVRTLVHEMQEPAVYRVKFDAAGLPSGTYWYKLTTPEFTDSKAMEIVR